MSSSIAWCDWKTWACSVPYRKIKGHLDQKPQMPLTVCEWRHESYCENIPQHIHGNSCCVGCGNILAGTTRSACMNGAFHEPDCCWAHPLTFHHILLVFSVLKDMWSAEDGRCYTTPHCYLDRMNFSVNVATLEGDCINSSFIVEIRELTSHFLYDLMEPVSSASNVLY